MCCNSQREARFATRWQRVLQRGGSDASVSRTPCEAFKIRIGPRVFVNLLNYPVQIASDRARIVRPHHH